MSITPGSYLFEKQHHGKYLVLAERPNKCPIEVAECFSEPNARLFAAAPEMKGLLYKAHEKLADLNNNYELGDDNPVDLCFEIRNILHYIEGQAWLEEETE